MAAHTVPGLSTADGEKLAEDLQKRLTACNDLHLTLKHVHWNVVGPNFIAVHEMLDPQIELVRAAHDGAGGVWSGELSHVDWATLPQGRQRVAPGAAP